MVGTVEVCGTGVGYGDVPVDSASSLASQSDPYGASAALTKALRPVQ